MSGAQNRKQAFTEEAVMGNLFISGMALKIFVDADGESVSIPK